ncbi:TRAP transporter large permease [Celeribacter indicus]|uniref:TRAP transporter large permease protein n=1 Tax=Celeribacter indicus TaxID=1208324 RepID=A0A0B5DYC8_9RHOB|nr:TRAP transporter large permease [Celeribacter indicus]AJE48458.1 TRAP dicarboxylate transporter subunit DctM [Celeribacter indicus]SDX28860.1 TRAP transporter, DctM subunit [Celeribacter indicus]
MIVASLSIVLIVVLLLVEVPVAFAVGAGVIVFALAAGQDLAYLAPSAFQQLGSYALLSAPLFIISGTVMARSGISEAMIRVVDVFLGGRRSGFGAVTVISCALFGAISGSGAAAIAGVGSIMIPRMEAAGYPRSYATALVGCSSVLALMIPPSIPMIVFAMTANLSVAACFLSTVVPGILLAGVYCIYNWRVVRKFPEDPKAAVEYRVRATDVVGALRKGAFALALPPIILGGIYSGLTTPTEAAAISILYAVPVGIFVYRGLTVKELGRTLFDAVVQTGSFVIIIFFLFNLSRLMILEGLPASIAAGIADLSQNRYVVLLLINLVMLVMGMLVDDVSGSILAAVILMPLATQAGVDPIHFAAIVGTNLGLGNVSPPCAPLLFVAVSVGRSSVREVAGPTIRALLCCHLPMTVIVTFLPDLSLALPRLLLDY